MSENTTVNTAHPAPEVKPKKKKRIFLWVFLLVQAIFIYWIVAGTASADLPDCTALTGSAYDDCNLEATAGGIGTGIGVMLVVGVWMVVDFLLAVGYGVYRLAKRPEPQPALFVSPRAALARHPSPTGESNPCRSAPSSPPPRSSRSASSSSRPPRTRPTAARGSWAAATTSRPRPTFQTPPGPLCPYRQERLRPAQGELQQDGDQPERRLRRRGDRVRAGPHLGQSAVVWHDGSTDGIGAKCPTGTIVTGGGGYDPMGWEIGHSGPDLNTDTKAVVPNSWIVLDVNWYPLVSFANCVSLTGAAVPGALTNVARCRPPRWPRRRRPTATAQSQGEGVPDVLNDARKKAQDTPKVTKK